MRPVERGAASRTYTEYGDAQPDLIRALGRYCSYCGRFIPEGIAVEHKRPKKRYPAEELLWSNFLLSCSNCNSSKGHSRVKLADFLWPDTDNTLRAISHVPGGLVRASRRVPKRIRKKANRTIRLHGLDRYPGAHQGPTDRDYRWLDRQQQWDKAMLFLRLLGRNDTPEQRDAIVSVAVDGIFSIWWTVFAGDMDMRRRLRQAFIGTHAASFDSNEELVARQGGQV